MPLNKETKPTFFSCLPVVKKLGIPTQLQCDYHNQHLINNHIY